MNTIIKIYIYNMHTHKAIHSNQNIEKSSSGKSSFKSLICAMILYRSFCCNFVRIVRFTAKWKNSFSCSKILGFIPQSSKIRTQAVINIELWPCWKVEVSGIKIIFFDTYRVLANSSAEKFHMFLLLFLPSRLQASILSLDIFIPIWCRTLQTVGSSWSCTTEWGMLTTSTHSWRYYCVLPFYWTKLL